MNIESAYNFRRVDSQLTTSGVVVPDALRSLASQGYKVVVNLLPETNEHAIPGERAIVESQNMEYIYIPVEFGRPTRENFQVFCAALDRISDRKTHLHCAANFRVSAFYSLYEVGRHRWTAEQAMAFILGVWDPNQYPAWPEFIDEILGSEEN